MPEHVLALEELAGQPRPVPSEHDRWVLRAMLTVLRTLPDGKGYGAARTELKRHRLLDTTAVHAYGSVLEELALVGVVATAEHPGLVRRWSDYVERDQRPSDRVVVQAPPAWWRSSDGLREDVAREVFADFDTGDAVHRRGLPGRHRLNPYPPREIAPVSGWGGSIGHPADPTAPSGRRLKGDLAHPGGSGANNTVVHFPTTRRTPTGHAPARWRPHHESPFPPTQEDS
ncbi:hypothetical protein AB0383_12630 [Amycolatopsis sp. NPDC051373]|uniref:hypothetical protein n=1 Tax=Amycolatopsis sp. NPDC051373 TaxID=3155801 RepID=UPI00344E9C12